VHLVEQEQNAFAVGVRGVADLGEELDDVDLGVAGVGDAGDRVEVEVEAPLAVSAEGEGKGLEHAESPPDRLAGAPALVEVAQGAVAELWRGPVKSATEGISNVFENFLDKRPRDACVDGRALMYARGDPRDRWM
jgi:hypothetical protein